MSLFGSLFDKGFKNPPKERWDGIIKEIHTANAEARPEFFKSFIKCMRVFPDAVVRNEIMTKEIELAFMICQLLYGRLLIASKQYVPLNQGQEFIDSMFFDSIKLCGIVKKGELVRRYFEDSEDGINTYLFCSDIANHITGTQEPHWLAIKTMTLSPAQYLRLFSFWTVARAFGDNVTMNEVDAARERLSKSGG